MKKLKSSNQSQTCESDVFLFQFKKISRKLAYLTLNILFLLFSFQNLFAQSWDITGSVSIGRTQFSSTILANGKVLISGGITYNSNYMELSPLCEIYDPSTETWSSTGSLNTPRSSHSSITLPNGKVLVFGGGEYACELYDPSTGYWSYTGSLNVPRNSSINNATLMANGKVLVIGGYNSEASCEIYDPSTGIWEMTDSLITGRADANVILLSNGNVLVVGGYLNNIGFISSCEIYNPSTGTWTTTDSLNTAGITKCIKLSNGKVLSLGVENNFINDTTIEIYDPSTGTWSIKGSLTNSNTYSSGLSNLILLPNDKILLLGNSVWASPEIYDPTTNSFNTIVTMNTSREDYKSVLLNSGDVLVISGRKYPNLLTSCEIYRYCIGERLPTGANELIGNITLTTQTQMDEFLSNINGVNKGKKWTKVIGNLTINGNSSTDPITSFCNLSALTEVTGHLLIQQFTKYGNPIKTNDLSNLTKVGRLTLITNPNFESILFNNLTDVAGSLIIRGQRNCKSIRCPVLSTVGGGQFNISRNHRVEIISFSEYASSLTLIGNTEATSLDIQNNGDSTSRPLTMNFNNLREIPKNLTFRNNSNSGVRNFDAIFSILEKVDGKLDITDNKFLSSCCVAYWVNVGAGRTISGNTGDCIDSTYLASHCSTTRDKRQRSKSMLEEHSIKGALLNVSPNPNNGNFTLELKSASSGSVALSITDLLGRQVYTISSEIKDKLEIPLNLEFAAKGQYIVKVHLNNDVFLKKIILIK